MKYWGEHQTIDWELDEGEQYKPPQGYPAVRGQKVVAATGTVLSMFELEVVPGTDRVETFVDMTSGTQQDGVCADVLVREKQYPSDPWKEDKVVFPLSFMGLDSIPTPELLGFDPNEAWDRAMQVI